MYAMHGSKDASPAKARVGQGELGIDEWYQRYGMKLVWGGQSGVVDFGQHGQWMWTMLMRMDGANMVQRHEWIDPPNHCWHRPRFESGDDEDWSTWVMW